MKKIFQKNSVIKYIILIVIFAMLLCIGILLTSKQEDGIIAKVQQTIKAQLETEITEALTSAIQKLREEKQGEATLDDITQEWIDSVLSDYNNNIEEDALILGKRVIVKKGAITKKYIIDEELEITENSENEENIEFSYIAKQKNDNEISLLIKVQDKENGISKIEFGDNSTISLNGTKEERGIDYKTELGTEKK